MELADVTDSKSVDGDIVWVRVPPPAPTKKSLLFTDKGDFLNVIRSLAGTDFFCFNNWYSM